MKKLLLILILPMIGCETIKVGITKKNKLESDVQIDTALESDSNQLIKNHPQRRHVQLFYESGNIESDGNYLNGKKDGLWTFYNDDNDYWSQGNFLEGKKVGLWKFYYDIDSTLEQKGRYLNGKKDGIWESFYKSGQIYQSGNYENGYKIGHWDYYYENGNKLQELTFVKPREPSAYNTDVGCVEGNCKNGYGTYIQVNGNRYVGEFVLGDRYGTGTMSYKDGSIYIGEWKKNKKDGIGTMNYENGNFYKGEWKNDKKDGKGTYYENKWFYWIGDWSSDQKHGDLLWADENLDTLYYGQWKDDKRHGYGIGRLEKPDRSVRYEGYFRKGRYHGKGKKIYESGTNIEALYEYGKSVGNCLTGNCYSEKSTGEYFSDWGDFKYTGDFKDGLWYGDGVFISNDAAILDLQTIKSVWGDEKSFSEHWSDE